MRVHSWSVLLPLLAAAAAMAGVYAYHRLYQVSPETSVTAQYLQPASVAPEGQRAGSGEFSFNAYDSPRPLAEVPFVNEEGSKVTLADFRGKAVLLNLWATWCVPCREEMPTLDRLEAKLGGKEFEVVALSLDQEGVPVVKEFYEELGLENLGVYVDDRIRAPALLGVIGVPATLLINRDGLEIGRKLGPAEWDSPAVVAEIQRHLYGSGN